MRRVYNKGLERAHPENPTQKNKNKKNNTHFPNYLKSIGSIITIPKYTSCSIFEPQCCFKNIFWCHHPYSIINVGQISVSWERVLAD